MILSILSVIALTVGVVHSSADLSEADQLALEDSSAAIVQVVPPQEDLEYPQLGL
jgi:hypothetical protein